MVEEPLYFYKLVNSYLELDILVVQLYKGCQRGCDSHWCTRV